MAHRFHAALLDTPSSESRIAERTLPPDRAPGPTLSKPLFEKEIYSTNRIRFGSAPVLPAAET